MKTSYIRARLDARRGDLAARKALGLKYLTGVEENLPADPSLALHYLEPFLDDPGIAAEVAAQVPLDFLMRTGRLDLLHRTADMSPRAAIKLGTLMYLMGEVDTGSRWIAVWAKHVSADNTGEGGPDIRGELFAALRNRELMSGELVLHQALQDAPDDHLPTLIQIALAVDLASAAATEKLLDLLGSAERGEARVDPLSPEEIFDCLSKSRCRVSYVHRLLGCALIGFDCGHLSWHSLVPKQNYREGYARLLRAAHGEEPRAWYSLYKASSDYRSVLANLGAALFFLEQAARAGDPRAHAALGAKMLNSARTLEDLINAQSWLCKAAAAGDGLAETTLLSFFPTTGLSSHASAESTLAKIHPLDPVLAAVLRTAREFQLTRKEAMSLDMQACVQGESLVFTPEKRASAFALPAVTAKSKDALRLLADSIRRVGGIATGAVFERRRAAAQRTLFDAYGFDERLFFIEFTADLGIRRDLVKWKGANGHLIKEIKDR